MIQSVAMAVEDAAVLAKLFSHLRREDQIGSFLWAFQDLRQDRVATLANSDLMNVLYMSQPASEQAEMRNQGYRDKQAAGINVLDNPDAQTEELWSELMTIWGYDAEDEADNWWVEWGLLRERAKGAPTLETLDYDVHIQVDEAVAVP
jgi:salicylate hydroxylase